MASVGATAVASVGIGEKTAAGGAACDDPAGASAACDDRAAWSARSSRSDARSTRSCAIVAVWLVSGFLPIVPVYITKGGDHGYFLGSFALFIFCFDPLGRWPYVVTHVILSGFLGLIIGRTIERLARLIRPLNPIR